MIPSLDDIQDARGRIARAAVRTPLLRFHATRQGWPPGREEANARMVAGPRCQPSLEQSGRAPAGIYLKLESLQPIGSFKIRGASNALAHLTPEQLARGVLTASAGNMAQGVAWCARDLGIPCTVVAPATAPRTKIEAIERLGGRVILAPFEQWWNTFQSRAYPGVDATFVHAFDDLHVMAGNGTIALEILEELPEVDTIVVPWGGGGLACGIAAAVRALKPRCRILAAEVASAAPLAAAMAAGAPRNIVYEPSFVDGIGARTVFPEMFARAKTLIDGVLVASLEEVAGALRLLAERGRIIAEGAGACALACALGGGAGEGHVVCIVSGGNIDTKVLGAILGGTLP